METSRRVKNRVVGVAENMVAAGVGGAVAIVLGLLLVFAYMNAKGVEVAAEQSADMAQEIRWLKTRVANLEQYSGTLEAQIKGLEIFDVTFSGDQADAMRHLYDAAVEQEFQRIKESGGVTLGQ